MPTKNNELALEQLQRGAWQQQMENIGLDINYVHSFQITGYPLRKQKRGATVYF